MTDRKVLFGIPGDLNRPTGGFRYDREIIKGLSALGWAVGIAQLGESYPFPNDATLTALDKVDAVLSPSVPFVVDGLALGALPDHAARWAERAPLIALVHHPLCLEAGHSDTMAAQLKNSERTALDRTHHVIVTGAATKQTVADIFAYPRDRISVIEPALKVVAALPNSGPDVRLLAIGAIIPRKRYPMLIEALAPIANAEWRLIIVGETTANPDETALLRSTIEKAGVGDRIRIVGALDDGALNAVRAGSQVFVSASAYEGYGMAVAEAVAAGLHTIATDTGAAKSLVAKGQGEIIPVDDPDALANALATAIASVSRGQWVPKRAPHRSWERASEEFAGVLDGLI